MLDPIIYQ